MAQARLQKPPFQGGKWSPWLSGWAGGLAEGGNPEGQRWERGRRQAGRQAPEGPGRGEPTPKFPLTLSRRRRSQPRQEAEARFLLPAANCCGLPCFPVPLRRRAVCLAAVPALVLRPGDGAAGPGSSSSSCFAPDLRLRWLPLPHTLPFCLAHTRTRRGLWSSWRGGSPGPLPTGVHAFTCEQGAPERGGFDARLFATQGSEFGEGVFRARRPSPVPYVGWGESLILKSKEDIFSE